MSCKDCKYSPKTYEEYFMGGSCPDAFTDIAVNCGIFDQSNKNKEKQEGKEATNGRPNQKAGCD